MEHILFQNQLADRLSPHLPQSEDPKHELETTVRSPQFRQVSVYSSRNKDAAHVNVSKTGKKIIRNERIRRAPLYKARYFVEGKLQSPACVPHVLMNRTASLRICDIFKSRNDLLCNYTILQAHSHPSIQASDIFGHAFSTGQMAPVLEQFNIPEEATKAAASGSEN